MDWLYWEPEAEWTGYRWEPGAEWTGYTGNQRLSGMVILGTRVGVDWLY